MKIFLKLNVKWKQKLEKMKLLPTVCKHKTTFEMFKNQYMIIDFGIYRNVRPHP